MNDQQDAELLQKYLNGDDAAFGELYRKYYKRVYGFCFRMVRNRSEVDDIVQTVFIKAVESIRTLENPGLFYYWIFTIARNITYAHLRRSKADELSSANEAAESDTPHDLFVRNETSAVVIEALGRLKDEYREVLVLKQFEHLSYNEIALVTGDTLSSVESRLFKARKALAVLLAPYWKQERLL